MTAKQSPIINFVAVCLYWFKFEVLVENNLICFGWIWKNYLGYVKSQVSIFVHFIKNLSEQDAGYWFCAVSNLKSKRRKQIQSPSCLLHSGGYDWYFTRVLINFWHQNMSVSKTDHFVVCKLRHSQFPNLQTPPPLP